jgi:hypothetical protein
MKGETVMTRPIHEIAYEISRDWQKPYFGAVPYLEAMYSLTHIHDNFYEDTMGLVFATTAVAEAWAQDLLLRWFVPTAARATESTDPVNYTYDREKGLVRIEDGSDVAR